MNALLSIGSNFGHRMENVEAALEFISGIAQIKQKSAIYESPDCLGMGRKYMNAVVEISTVLKEEELNTLLKSFESERGRDKDARERGEVSIDIDIVTWGKNIRRQADFTAHYFRIGLDSFSHKIF